VEVKNDRDDSAKTNTSNGINICCYRAGFKGKNVKEIQYSWEFLYSEHDNNILAITISRVSYFV